MYLLNALPALKEAGLEIEFLCLYPKSSPGVYDNFKEKMEASGVACHAIAFSRFPFVRTLRKIHLLIRESNYDLVHTHLIHADFLLAYYKRILNPRLKLVSTKHGYQEWYNNRFGFNPEHKRNNFYLKVARFAERQVNKSIAISEGLQKLYTGLDICPADKLELIPYGFNFPNSLKEEKQFRFGEKQLVLVGRLTAFKGHRYALNAMKILKLKYPELRLVFVGNGPEEEALKSLTKKLELEDVVVFTGYSPEARKFMKNSDVVLVPSVSEGFGVVVLEAFSVSKPIVAFDVPSLNERIEDGINGRLIPAYEIEQYAAAIDDLLSHPESMTQYGDAGHKKLVEYYNIKRMTEDTLDFYNDLLPS